MLELYHAGLTVCSIKSRLCLREKGLDYVSHYVSLRNFEQHRPEYLALNPNGVVPTLVHDGVPIIESSVINEYLDEVFPEPPLRPADAAGRARVRVWAKLSDDALAPNRVANYAGGKGSVIQSARTMDADALERILAGFPLPERRDTLRKAAAGRFTQDDFLAAREKAAFILDRLETALGANAYLLGDDFTLADLNMIAFVDRFRDKVVPDLVSPERLPRTCDWYARIMARPAVAWTFAPSEETRDPNLADSRQG